MLFPGWDQYLLMDLILSVGSYFLVHRVQALPGQNNTSQMC